MQRVDQDEAIVLDAGLLRLRYKQKCVQLTVKEFRLIEALISNTGRALSRAQLLDATDPTMKKDVYYRAIDSHIKRLRQRIQELGVADGIKTLRGIGYYWEFET